jgi:hypothetical protein
MCSVVYDNLWPDQSPSMAGDVVRAVRAQRRVARARRRVARAHRGATRAQARHRAARARRELGDEQRELSKRLVRARRGAARAWVMSDESSVMSPRALVGERTTKSPSVA